MENHFRYVSLSGSESLGLFLTLLAAAIVIYWALIYKLGEFILNLFFRSGENPYPYFVPLAALTGLWAFEHLSLFLGIAGVFSFYSFCVAILVVVLASATLKIPMLPSGRFWKKIFGQNRWIFLWTLISALLIASISISHFVPWFDGNYMITAGHLARTGKLIPEMATGQFGITFLVAAVNLFFPVMSAITSSIAWGPFFGPLILVGVYLLLLELFENKKWACFSVVVLGLPTVFKAYEIRGAVLGFGEVIWVGVFFLRYLRTFDRKDLLGGCVALGGAWNVHQLSATYAFTTLIAASFFFWLKGKREQAGAVWKLLFFTSLLEWVFIAFDFRWILGSERSWFLDFVPALLATFISGIVLWRLKSSRNRGLDLRYVRVIAIVLLGSLLCIAVIFNPLHTPTYSWYSFANRPWFGAFNFSSYGLVGFGYLIGLILAGNDFLRLRPTKVSYFLLLGFGVSCLFQIVPMILISSPQFTFIPERAFLWDIWKDTALHWSNPFMVIAIAYFVKSLEAFSKQKIAPSGIKWAVSFAVCVCTQRVQPYIELFSGDTGTRIHRALSAQISPDVDHPFRGQQSYSILGYLSYAFFLDDYRFGKREQLLGCKYCTVQGYGFNRSEWGLIDFLQSAPLLAGDAFIVGDSVLTSEIYLNLQVRYKSGINTVCPVYFQHLDPLTSYEYFWKPKMRIRRNSRGMAYTVTDPKRHLLWLQTKADKDGELRSYFSVPVAGDYEIYRGGESIPAPALARINGVLLRPQSGPSLGFASLEPGRNYELALSPDEKPVRPETPTVLYPRRHWEYERVLIDEKGVGTFGYRGFDSIGLARFTGIHSAPIAVEEIETIMRDEIGHERLEVLKKYQIRYIVMDPTLLQLFPNAAEILSKDRLLGRYHVNGTEIYILRK